MFRFMTACAALALVVATADAQPRTLPLAPGVMPGSPFGPGMPINPPVPPVQSQASQQSGPFFNPILLGWGFGYQGYNPYFYGPNYGYGYGSTVPPIVISQSQQNTVIQAPNRAPSAPVLTNEYPATLTLQLPVAGEVWLNGKKVKGENSEEHVLVSPVLKSDGIYTFDVKARWTYKGKTFEAKRAVTLVSGERSRLLLVSGDEVKVEPPPAPPAAVAPAPRAVPRGRSALESLVNRVK
jgi:hypothetical protein